jgi:hypothetical protein
VSAPGLAPVLAIILPLEGAPLVRLHCMNDGEEARLVDWIRSRDELAALVARALEYAEEEPPELLPA